MIAAWEIFKVLCIEQADILRITVYTGNALPAVRIQHPQSRKLLGINASQSIDKPLNSDDRLMILKTSDFYYAVKQHLSASNT